MYEIVIGTGNPAKKKAVQAALAPLGIAVLGTDDLNLVLDVLEDGATAQENARKKSLAYARALGRPVLSIDNALYMDGLRESEQPGIYTRRVPGREGRATDAELLEYFTRRVEALGGKVRGHWEYAVCIADSAGRTFERSFLSHRLFVNQPSTHMLPGYPLESIQIEPESGRYVSEMTDEEQAVFWQKTVGQPLSEFVRDAETYFGR